MANPGGLPSNNETVEKKIFKPVIGGCLDIRTIVLEGGKKFHNLCLWKYKGVFRPTEQSLILPPLPKNSLGVNAFSWASERSFGQFIPGTQEQNALANALCSCSFSLNEPLIIDYFPCLASYNVIVTLKKSLEYQIQILEYNLFGN